MYKKAEEEGEEEEEEEEVKESTMLDTPDPTLGHVQTH